MPPGATASFPIGEPSYTLRHLASIGPHVAPLLIISASLASHGHAYKISNFGQTGVTMRPNVLPCGAVTSGVAATRRRPRQRPSTSSTRTVVTPRRPLAPFRTPSAALQPLTSIGDAYPARPASVSHPSLGPGPRGAPGRGVAQSKLEALRTPGPPPAIFGALPPVDVNAPSLYVAHRAWCSRCSSVWGVGRWARGGTVPRGSSGAACGLRRWRQWRETLTEWFGLRGLRGGEGTMNPRPPPRLPSSPLPPAPSQH